MTALCIGLLIGLLITDMGAKRYVERNISPREEIPVLKGKILVRHVRNEGMAMNLLEDYPAAVKWLSFTAIVPMAVLYVRQLRKKGENIEKVSLSLMLGGAISNLYDRFVRKYVVDYFGFRCSLKKLENITFNLADIFIFAGAAGILLTEILKKRK